MSLPYENVRMEDGQGAILGYISFKRAKWYLDRDLARSAEDNGIVLTFEPKGRSEAGTQETLGPRLNRCVVCGTSENLTRHHVVPYCIRRHMSLEWKSHNSYDVLPLCEEHHRKYTTVANAFVGELRLRINSVNPWSQSIIKALCLSKSLLIHGHLMEKGDYQKRLKIVEEETGYKDIDASTLLLLSKLPHRNFKGFQERSFKEMAQNTQQTVLTWCRHFFDTMKPQFMINDFSEEEYTHLLMTVVRERIK